MSNFLFKKKVLKHILYNEEKFHINSAWLKGNLFLGFYLSIWNYLIFIIIILLLLFFFFTKEFIL